MEDNKASKILIVDDNTFFLALLKTVLKDVNAVLYMASSGSEALSLIKANDFALAVLDIEMPEMDGFELASSIQNLKERDLLPIIFLSTYNTDEIQVFKGYDNGAIDYLTKPINKTVFLSKVRIFLKLDQQKKSLIASKELIQQSKFELEQRQQQLINQNKILLKAQQDLEESKNKYLKLYNFAPTGFFTIDRNGVIKDCNVKSSMLFGFDSSTLNNKNIKELIDQDSLNVFDDFLRNLLIEKSHSGCELSRTQNNGTKIYLYLEGVIIDDKQTCMLSVADITERKEAQMALKASEKLYHSLVKTSPDGIIINNLDGYITEASDTAVKLLGANEKKEIIGSHFMNFVPKNALKSALTAIISVIDKGMVQNFEIPLLKSDKTEFTGEISITQIKDDNGETNSFMSVVREVSERKLIEKRLRHTERMTGIGEMATGMAHEINQPLNTISLSIDNILFTLENKTITEEYLKGKLNKVFDNITRIKKIIDHVRTFSRDQDDFVQTDFNVNESIKNSLSMISEQLGHREIELDYSLDDKIPDILGNGYRFEQVIVNLLVNAKDAIEERRKKACIKFEKKVEVLSSLENNHIVVEVKDTGIGIPNEKIDKVLLPFYTTKAPGQGTGLGLSVSYGIIKELGGEIEIKSLVNAGTTILIKIPLVQSKNTKRR